MSTVKIKKEPTAAATAAEVDVKVKLEPSLSAGDIKLEQYTSDIDTKLESGSEADSEEEDTEQRQATEAPKKKQKVLCKHPGCGRSFNHSSYLSIHRHDHKHQVELYAAGKTYTLTRQSLGDRWQCPVPDCTASVKAVDSVYRHIRKNHGGTTNQQYQQHQQQHRTPAQTAQRKYCFLDVDNLYVNGVCCGYHSTTGAFVCHECRLVPECLLTHLQQKHGYDEKSINNSALPESVRKMGSDPNINQHTSNTHLVSAINQPFWQHQDIIQGWLCVTSDCGYCGYTLDRKNVHKKKMHRGERLATMPALVLRLMYTKSSSCCFLITRIDRASGAVTTSGSNTMTQHKLGYSHSESKDDESDDTSQNETTDASNQIQQWKCEYSSCGRLFESSRILGKHRREHKLEVMTTVQGNAYTLCRQSLDDRWTCPVPDCVKTCKTIHAARVHILYAHNTSFKQKRVNGEDDNQQLQQHSTKRAKPTIQYLNVDDFYVCGARYGYHTTTGLFICYECQLVPDCLLTHLQQKHGLDEKSIGNEFLPESARVTGSNPNVNQHSGNSYLAASFRDPHQWRNSDIVQGWMCVTSNCGYCCSTKMSRSQHQYKEHYGEQLVTVPALVLRLLYTKAHTSSLFITRIDQVTTTDNNVQPSNSVSQHIGEGDDDDGDELVLSDMGDDDDIN